MGKNNRFRKIVLVLLFIWIGTISYIWLPSIIPDFLHLHCMKTPSSLTDFRLLDATGTVCSMHNSSQSHQGVIKQLDNAVHVVITSDSNTVGGMVALINSIISNTQSTVFFHLITNKETSSHLRKWLMQSKLRNINYEIKEFPMDWVDGKIKVRGGRAELANPLNYARFYLPRLFPNIAGRVVYIDDDCIVQGDIKDLYHMHLKPGTLASFSEDCVGLNKRITFMQNVYADFFDLKNKHFKELEIDPRACAFNTGVFVTDLSDWRQMNITKQLEYWLELNTREELYGNERGGGGSQPPMMLVFYKNYTPLDEIWHVHFLGLAARSSYSQQFIRNAKLLHWNGHFKPWGRTSAYQEIWNHYYISDPTGQFQPVRKGFA